MSRKRPAGAAILALAMSMFSVAVLRRAGRRGHAGGAPQLPGGLLLAVQDLVTPRAAARRPRTSP